MKIESNKPHDTQGATRGAQNVQKGQAPQQQAPVSKTAAAAPADKVDISARSKQIADIKASVNELPDVREQKVEQIRQSVEAGTYTVDPRKVAERIIKEI